MSPTRAGAHSDGLPEAAEGRLRVLTVNTGSSSLKAGVYAVDPEVRILAGFDAVGLGTPTARFRTTRDTKPVADESLTPPDHAAALGALTAFLTADLAPDAVGHRVVHGGSEFHEPQLVTAEFMRALEALIPLAPNHLPQAIQGIATLLRAYPSTPQIACFDTAFHQHMPPYAKRYALPPAIVDQGVRRYGFHGLSYESILEALTRVAPTEARGRLIVGHLGNGASLAALRNGTSVETTMGFSPAGGLVMGTRPGDLDPGVLIRLLDLGMSRDEIQTLFTRESGLIGVSRVSADMRELLARETDDPQVAGAIELFCYQARKSIGALAAVLGGLDTLVFTGGMGEHAPSVRTRITRELAFLGVRLDEGANERNENVISAPGGRVTVRVMHSDEDLMIARHTRDVLRRTGAHQ